MCASVPGRGRENSRVWRFEFRAKAGHDREFETSCDTSRPETHYEALLKHPDMQASCRMARSLGSGLTFPVAGTA